MTKLWLLTTEFPPFSGGGVGTYCEELARAASQTSVLELTIFAANGTEVEVVESQLYSNVRLIRFHHDLLLQGSPLHGAARLAYAFKLVIMRYLEKFAAPDAIEGQDYLGITYYLLMEKLTGNLQLRNIPISVCLHSPEYIVHQHNAAPSFRFPEYWNGVMERFCIKAADFVSAPSRHVVEEIKRDVGDFDAEIIRNPFSMLPEHHGYEDGEGIYYFGRIQSFKGVEELLNAYAALVALGVREKLYIVGGDSDFKARGMAKRAYLEKRFKLLVDEGRVVFTGLLSRHEALRHIAKAKVVVVPSKYESFSYACLEAMAHSRVILTSTSVGLREILIDGVNGFTFSHGIEGDLVEKLKMILELSPDKRTEIGLAALRSVEEHCHPLEILDRKIQSIDKARTNHAPANGRAKFPFLNLRPVAKPRFSLPQDVSKGLPGMLTIVIPYFNMGGFISEAIASADASDLENKEILVLNASSTDPFSVAQFYAEREKYAHRSDIRFEHIIDRGLGDTRNRGAALARGEFLAFLDPDDLVEPTYYSRAIGVLSQYDNVGVVGCWVKHFGADRGCWITWNTELPYLLFHNTINTSSMVMKRDVFLTCGQNDHEMKWGMEDYEALLRIVSCGYGGVVLPDFLFKYRVRQNSMQRSFSRINDVMAYELITRKNPEIFREFAEQIVCLLNGNGPGFRHADPLQSVAI